MLELLGAMTVLLLILGIMATVLNESGRLWRLGTDRNRHLTGARAAFDLIAADLEQAVANSNLVFAITQSDSEFDPATDPDNKQNLFGFRSRNLLFTKVNTTPHSSRHRPLQEVWYGAVPVTNRMGVSLPGQYQLQRRHFDSPTYSDWPNPPEVGAPDYPPGSLASLELFTSAPLLDGVAALSFDAVMSDGGSLLNGHEPFAYTNTLPAYVDIYLELLTPAEARRAAGLPDDRQADFVDRHVIRLTRRVALNPIELP